MKNWIKKITGIADLEASAQTATDIRIAEEQRIQELINQRAEFDAKAKDAELAAQKAQEAAVLATMTVKEQATANGESWVNVLDIHLNQDDIRNGFFELDWNEYFVTDLVLNGYGTKDDPEEEVVDRWFKEIVSQMLTDEGMDPRRGAGYINVTPLAKGKSEIS